MKLIKTFFNDRVKIIKPTVYKDNRGYFCETYNYKELIKFGIKDDFVQDNNSLSKKKNTFRGLHLQLTPFQQSKIVRCIKGSFIDIIVDLRLSSSTYLEYKTIKISEKNMYQVYIPKNFAHGFITLENDTIINYKTSGYFNKTKAVSISLYDSMINFKMPDKKSKLIMSKNDINGIFINDYERLNK